MVRSALRFVLAQDVSVVVTGMKSIEEVDAAAQVGNEYTEYTTVETNRFKVQFDGKHCRDCGLCLACPQDIDIAAILRFQTLYSAYGLKNWAKKLYSGLEVNATDCTECGVCEPKCPYNLSIMSLLKDTHACLRH